MQTRRPASPAWTDYTTTEELTLEDAIRNYMRTYVLWHGGAKAADTFGVSRHTLWRCLKRGRLGKSLPRAVIRPVGDDPDTIEAATWAITD